MNDKDKYIFHSFMEALFLVFSTLRIYTLRHRARTTVSQWICEIFFYIAFITGNLKFIFNVWSIARSAQINKKFPPAMAKEILAEPSFLKAYLANRVGYVVTLWSIKAAFVSFYFGLFPPNRVGPAYRGALYFAACFVGATFLLNLGTCLFWCLPVHTNWSLGQKSCSSAFSPTRLSILFATNMVSDLFIIFLPFSVLHFLNLRRREMVALSLVFAVGFASVGAAAATYWHNHRVIAHPSEKSKMSQSLSLLTTTELTTAMVCFCAPAFRSWLRWFGRIATNRSGGRSGGKSGNGPMMNTFRARKSDRERGGGTESQVELQGMDGKGRGSDDSLGV